jgi:hypothetical protein
MRHPRVAIVYYIISIDLYTVSANLLHVITSLDVAVRLLRVTLTAVGSPCLLEELDGCWHYGCHVWWYNYFCCDFTFTKGGLCSDDGFTIDWILDLLHG